MRLGAWGAAAVGVLGCSVAAEESPERGSVSDREPVERVTSNRSVFNEDLGRYQGVGIGSSRRRARKVFGRMRAGATEPLSPLGRLPLEVGFPSSPRDPKGARGGYQAWRFDGTALGAFDGRAYLLTVTRSGTRTLKGVGVGSTLSAVRRRYPRMGCERANRGGDYAELPFCTGSVGQGRYLWFGRDPVRSITVSTAPLR